MKRKNLVILIALVCLGFLFASLSLPLKAATLSRLDPMAGPVGELVKFTGSVGCGNNYEIYWDNFNDESLILKGQATACKYATGSFRVPETYKGRHRVILVDVQSDEEATYNFTVIPQIKASAEKGQVGTTVTISGTGFAANESDIRLIYEGTQIADSLSSNIKGSWQTTITIPESPKGKHPFQASGSLTNADEVLNASFEVIPKISLKPSFGGIGAEVTVTGTGFGSSETDITITFNGTPVSTWITANSLGSFSTTFTVPLTEKKENAVNVFVKNDRVTEASNVIFTVGTAITLEPAKGYVGQEVSVFGSGFAPNEDNIKLIYDNTEVSKGITADKNGVWTSTFTVPASAAGSHTVTASGSSTAVKEVKIEYFIVMPRLTLEPISGGTGTTIKATGSGFDKSQPVTIMYDDIKLTLEISTDTNGNFTAEFKAPVSTGEQHQVKATTGSNNTATATFFTETTPPPTPSLLSPAPGARVGLIGKQAVAFEWSEVTDLSGVSYVLEISHKSDFIAPMLQRRGLTENKYTLSETEALEQGNYYWRVKAIDGAGNESDWTTAQAFTVSGLKLNTLLIIAGIIIAAFVVIILLWRLTPIMGKKQE